MDDLGCPKIQDLVDPKTDENGGFNRVTHSDSFFIVTFFVSIFVIKVFQLIQSFSEIQFLTN